MCDFRTCMKHRSDFWGIGLQSSTTGFLFSSPIQTFQDKALKSYPTYITERERERVVFCNFIHQWWWREDNKMGKGWKIIPRPLLESVLNNHVQHHRVPQLLIVHGPRGVGKTTLFLHSIYLHLSCFFSLPFSFVPFTFFWPVYSFYILVPINLFFPLQDF